MNTKLIEKIAMVLVVIGAVNWGLVGLFDLNLVDEIFGSIKWLEDTVYILVGLSGVYAATLIFKK